MIYMACFHVACEGDSNIGAFDSLKKAQEYCEDKIKNKPHINMEEHYTIEEWDVKENKYIKSYYWDKEWKDE